MRGQHDAIAEFERRLITPNSRFDRSLAGDKKALSEKETKGYAAFQEHRCASCHAGPALGDLGPLGTYGGMPSLAKVVLIFAMWAGRLEFLTVFALLTPVFWRELLRYRRGETKLRHQK